MGKRTSPKESRTRSRASVQGAGAHNGMSRSVSGRSPGVPGFRDLPSSRAQGASDIEAWLPSALRSAADGVVITDADSRVKFLNRAAERLIGASSMDCQGKMVADVLRFKNRQGSEVRVDPVRLATLQGEAIGLGPELVLESADGERREIEGEIAVTEAAGSVCGAVITLRDVTARVRQEEQHLRDEKFRATARFAGALAHDFNDLLTVIVGCGDQLLQAIPPHHPMRAAVEQLSSASNTAASVTRELLSMASNDVAFPTWVDLNTIVEESCPELVRLLPPHIEITTGLSPAIGTVRADPDQLRLMILNAVLHARRSMPEGGRIHLETESVEIMPTERGRRLQNFVRLKITHSGVNLEGLDSVFRAAAPDSTGHRISGTELFIVLGIVEHMDGRMSLSSKAGVGSRLEILLPRGESDPLLATADETGEASAKATILVVEDDPDIRVLLHSHFDRSGYQVLEARDAEEALLVFDLYEGAIDLLITDVAMGGLSGTGLVRAVSPSRPETKVLFISGHSQERANVAEFVERGARFLQKPFRRDELLTQVEEMLRAPRPILN